MRKVLILMLVGSGFAACATPGSKPHDMSGAAHEVAASEAEQQAAAHAKQFDPEAEYTRQRCTGGGPRRWQGGGGWNGQGGAGALGVGSGWNDFPCWSQTVNPTREHVATASRLRKDAAAHRAASEALRAAEARACDGIPLEERDISPFFNREDITGVELEYDTTREGKFNTMTSRVAGATVVFRAVPGLTAEWLKRSVDCHLARNAVDGHDDPEQAFCPLVPRGVNASVKSTGSGFAVTMTSADPQTAAEVAKRAKALVAAEPQATGSPASGSRAE